MRDGRHPGQLNRITTAHNLVFSEAFDLLGGVDGLIKWAQGLEGTCTIPKDGNNLALFYTLFAKRLPKHQINEDLNRSHEQFIELMKIENQQRLETAGQPVGLIEVGSSVEKTDKDT